MDDKQRKLIVENGELNRDLRIVNWKLSARSIENWEEKIWWLRIENWEIKTEDRELTEEKELDGKQRKLRVKNGKLGRRLKTENWQLRVKVWEFRTTS